MTRQTGYHRCVKLRKEWQSRLAPVLSHINQNDNDRELAWFTKTWLTQVIRDIPDATIRRCAQCRNWYVNLWGHLNREYCSKKCAVYKIVTTQRAEEHRKKIEKARHAYQHRVQYISLDADWRPFVRRVTGLTQKFLSQHRREIESAMQLSEK